MAYINKRPLRSLGYDFVPKEYLPAGQDEYYLRFQQNPVASDQFRHITTEEIDQLIAHGNESSNWNDVLVSKAGFIPDQIRHSKFHGLVRIGKMDEIYVEYRDLRLASGIYHSQIISSDIGDYCAIHHVRYMAHYIVGKEVILTNIDEMETSSNAKFGNGVLKDGDDPESRIYLELCNENGGRSVLPFNGMQAGDVYLWTRHREDADFQRRLHEITDLQFSSKRGYYSMIGERTVIKNCHTIKNVQIGSDAYIKGVNKIKNVTVNSISSAYTQIGEGCELVNGIVGYGCRIFYGVKAVRFILSSFSQLKYGARLINSFLGDNSTISCCEVLNSLLFPAHEQHHNNSFLCASLIMGQSNMAAGATVGSNHNSRAADGELMAGRGFWPGLCVSLKHNSRFASYSLIVKGDFLHELDIRIPFSLISNDVHQDRLVIIPGYWFMYNMYALMRNTSKFTARDNRKLKNQHFEYDVIAPDTVNEMFNTFSEIENAVSLLGDEALRALKDPAADFQYEVLLTNVENSRRKVVLKKPKEVYHLFQRLIRYYAATQILSFIETNTLEDFWQLLQSEPLQRKAFTNVGSQLIPDQDLQSLISDIKTGALNSWLEIHQRYHQLSSTYLTEKLLHSIASLQELSALSAATWDALFVQQLMEESLETKRWIRGEIERTRAKDYESDFRKMLYNSDEEMEAVVGKLSDNSFILSQNKEMVEFESRIKNLLDVLASAV
ncbi:DUF4954 family protein [Sphingobacterium corticibacter]|uniref:DUF4954 domain-containing protein n=1 Tax=Sphingobacterium corticibacter TaxID=2171749 RepID=A0A2T8HM90_9SPHI|nr:DUF4954 family protein [Sphingobacterium corticibacter]PVH26554.1 DUF4954 domain-containing protein [Sphingobacterium corticibacter]